MGRDNSCLQCLEQQKDVGQVDLQGLLLLTARETSEARCQTYVGLSDLILGSL